jgi:hypothetical protein
MDKILTPSISQLLHNKAHYLKAFLIWLEAVFFMLMVRRLYLFQFPSRHNWRQFFSFFFASLLSCVQLGLLGHGMGLYRLETSDLYLNSKFRLYWKTLVFSPIFTTLFNKRCLKKHDLISGSNHLSKIQFNKTLVSIFFFKSKRCLLINQSPSDWEICR